MKKNNKKYLFFLFLFLFSSILPSIRVHAIDENRNFLSLKNGEVNVRLGPSKEYPIKFTYKKKFLPIEVLNQSETWRQIIDFENNSGWIHISQLSKKKYAINKKNGSILYKKATIYSKPIAKLEIGRLVLIKKCKLEWCKIYSGGYSGWIFKNSLWGKIK